LQKALDAQKADRDKAVASAEKKNTDAKKSDKEIAAAKKKAEGNFSKDITALTNNVNELTICDLLYASSDELDLSEEDSKKVAELLPKLKTVGKSRLAQMYLRSGDVETAEAKAAEAVSAADGQALPVAHQVEILLAAGKNDEALKAFAEMRKLAADADLDLSVFARVIEKVKALPGKQQAECEHLAGVDLDGDWRQVIAPAKDIGARPPHDDLGPFRWSPEPAADWTLMDGDGKKLGLKDFRGDPVLVIFYLGKGCVHCMEQLQAFSPQYEKYQEAGIEIVAIGLDSEAGLKETYALNGEGEKDPFPFPLLSNEKLDAFRAYRAFDDFENSALHGTYLIDGQGQIRWQDISYQPFMNAEWLLEECQRLLSLEGDKS
jgi:peroxiredoxin